MQADGFNEAHKRRLLAGAQYSDRLISDIESILSAADSKSPFLAYRPDLTLHQARLVRGYLARFREHLGRTLAAAGVDPGGPRFGSLHSIRVTLHFLRSAVQELAPEYLKGYGRLPDEGVSLLRGMCVELEGLIDALERSLAPGPDLQARLERLEQGGGDTDSLRLLHETIAEAGLTEFRAPLAGLVERIEAPHFEIAVFGRVSSGKSSLLNRFLERDLLPVGVNPITAVPTRIRWGEEGALSVTLAGGPPKRCPLEDLAIYASEEQNPGNERGVTRLTVTLPSPRLRDGLVLVDTPGLGSLATAGEAETRSYLPQCDLGIVLISAVSPVGPEDLNTVYALSQGGVPVLVLLSKADLLPPAEREKAAAYTRKELLAQLGLRLDVQPVSAVGEDEQLLERWFQDRLTPLLERSRELARQSIHRKAAALRESVAAALRARLSAGGVPTSSLEEVEERLRAAAVEVEETRQYCLSAAGEVRLLGEIALERAGRAPRETGEGSPPPEEILRSAAAQVAAEAAGQIASRLSSLAGRLDEALQFAARASEGRPIEGEPLRDCVREMPGFELALPAAAAPPLWLRVLPGAAWLWSRRRARTSALAALESAFTIYGRALEAWSRRVLAEIRRRFDSQAETYRAQAARLSGRGTLPAETKARLEACLAKLEVPAEAR